MSMINDENYLDRLFINEAKPAMERHTGGGSAGDSNDYDVVGTWVFNKILKNKIFDVNLTYAIGDTIHHGIRNINPEWMALEDYNGALFYDDSWEEEQYRTIKILEEPTDAEFIAWLNDNAVKLGNVVGTWRFNDVIEFMSIEIDEGKDYDVKFSTKLNDGVLCQFDTLSIYRYSEDGVSIGYYDTYGTPLEDVYDGGWNGAYYPTITITQQPTDAEFIAWLKGNAKKQSNNSSGDSGGENLKIDINNIYNDVIYGDRSFKGFDFVGGLNTPHCKEIGVEAFAESSVEEVKLGDHSSSRGVSIGVGAFARCDKLHTVRISHLNNIDQDAFNSCKTLESVKLDNVVKGNTPQKLRISTNAFYGCSKLVEFTLASESARDGILVDIVEGGAFVDCESLERIALCDCEYIYGNAFVGCTHLTALILHGSTICQAPLDAFDNTPLVTGEGHIYIPTSLYESYRSAYEEALNGVVPGFFDILFRKIEDYPEICG